MSNDGGPAFPVSGSFERVGMSLRDYFAIRALPVAASFFDTGEEAEAEVAVWCYRVADAMLAARDAK